MSSLLERFRGVTKPSRWFSVFCMAVGFVVVVGTIGSFVWLGNLVRDLPNVQKISFQNFQNRAIRSVQARRPQLETNRWISLNQVSEGFVDAVVTSEDALFFVHEGVDLGAIVDSMMENIRRKRYAFGASTITQQVVKNVFLTREKTIARKVREVLLSKKIEDHFSKKEILEVYMNIVELGPNLYGVAEAAAYYFGKSPSAINTAEGTFIALMLPAPKKHHDQIYLGKQLSPVKKKKYNRILGDLFRQQKLTQTQYDHFLDYPFFSDEPVGPVESVVPVVSDEFVEAEESEEAGPSSDTSEDPSGDPFGVDAEPSEPDVSESEVDQSKVDESVSDIPVN